MVKYKFKLTMRISVIWIRQEDDYYTQVGWPVPLEADLDKKKSFISGTKPALKKNIEAITNDIKFL